jgi:sugar lactone lactonase YvrE
VRLATLIDGLTFPEAPRWRDGCLFFSDFYSHQVYTLDAGGKTQIIAEVPGRPSGLGWLPNGDLLIVSMTDRRVLRMVDGQLSLYADLASLAPFHCNDMLVTTTGRAYVGNFGFDPHGEAPRPTDLFLIQPDGRCSIAASDLAFPNGMATLGDESRLVVAESVGQQLSVFDMDRGGGLSNRRVLVRLPGCQPDGICVDRDGNLLVTTMTCNQLVKISPTGNILQTTPLPTPVWACAVGKNGDIFLCTSAHAIPEDCARHRSGKIQLLKDP